MGIFVWSILFAIFMMVFAVIGIVVSHGNKDE